MELGELPFQYFILDGDQNPVSAGPRGSREALFAWADWYDQSTRDNSHVIATDELGSPKNLVITFFTGHSPWVDGDGRPLLYETRSWISSDICGYYATKAEALAGHAENLSLALQILKSNGNEVDRLLGCISAVEDESMAKDNDPVNPNYAETHEDPYSKTHDNIPRGEGAAEKPLTGDPKISVYCQKCRGELAFLRIAGDASGSTILRCTECAQEWVYSGNTVVRQAVAGD